MILKHIQMKNFFEILCNENEDLLFPDEETGDIKLILTKTVNGHLIKLVKHLVFLF